MGRQTDFIVTADGRVLHALAVIYVLRECPQVAKFQVVQESVDQVVVTLVPRGEMSSSLQEKITQDLGKVLGSGMQVSLVRTDNIATTASGKFRYVVSKVPAPHSTGSSLG